MAVVTSGHLASSSELVDKGCHLADWTAAGPVIMTSPTPRGSEL